MRRLARVAALALTLTLSSSAAALKCSQNYRETAFSRAARVVEGKVIAVSGRRPATVKLRVTRRWKGEPTPEVTFGVSGFKGGFEFTQGESYLVFIGDGADGLEVSDCSGTVALSEAEKQLELLGKQAASSGAAPSATAQPPAPTDPVASGRPPAAAAAPDPSGLAPASTAEPHSSTRAGQPAGSPDSAVATSEPGAGGCAGCAVSSSTEAPVGLGALFLVVFAAGRRRLAPLT